LARAPGAYSRDWRAEDVAAPEPVFGVEEQLKILHERAQVVFDRNDQFVEHNRKLGFAVKEL
jgi:hypothetical protein